MQDERDDFRSQRQAENVVSLTGAGPRQSKLHSVQGLKLSGLELAQVPGMLWSMGLPVTVGHVMGSNSG